MNDADKKLKFKRDMEKLHSTPIKSPNYTSPLDQDVMKVKRVSGEWDNDYVKKFPNSTEHIDTKSPLSTISGDDFKKKIAGKLKNPAGKAAMAGIGSMPLLGGLIQAGLSGDVLAAIDPTDSENVGEGSDLFDPSMMNEDYRQNSPEEQLDTSNMSPEEVHRFTKLRALMNR